MRFAIENLGFQDLLRAAARASARWRSRARRRGGRRCSTSAFRARDPARAPIALAFGTVALRNTPLMLKVLESDADRERALALLAEAFDMLEEDFERGAVLRDGAPHLLAGAGGSPRRAQIATTLIRKLEF